MNDTAKTSVVEDEPEPAWQRRKLKVDTEMDMTPMIDMTFLLLIFFLVVSTPSDPSLIVELPAAANATSVAIPESVTISVADGGEKAPAAVYLADGKVGSPLAGDWATQEAAIRQHIEAAKKKYVILKAERGLRHREVVRVARVVTSVEGITLHVAVMDRTE